MKTKTEQYILSYNVLKGNQHLPLFQRARKKTVYNWLGYVVAEYLVYKYYTEEDFINNKIDALRNDWIRLK